MKITNMQMAAFLNSAHEILEKKIPRRLYTAIALNMGALDGAAEVYNKLLGDIKGKCAEGSAGWDTEVADLMGQELELTAQTVTADVLDRMDGCEKFDALTGAQYAAIGFMVADA